MHKITLAGLAGDSAELLRGLQELGCVHLLSLQPAPPVHPERPKTGRVKEAYQALQWISDVSKRRHQVEDEKRFDFEGVIAQALDNKRRVRAAEDHQHFLKQRIASIWPWGDFTLPTDPQALGGYCLWFYEVPLGQLAALRALPDAYAEVHRDQRCAYVVAIARDEPDPALMPVPRVHVGALPLRELQADLESTEALLEDLQAERWSLSRWSRLLQRKLARAEDRAALEDAKLGVLHTDGMGVLQGWVAAVDLPRLEIFVREQRLALLICDPLPGEMPPTRLRNAPSLAGGEDLVLFFQTPGYFGIDPSPVVFFAFALFFAMILADAGYAVILGAALLWHWSRLGSNALGLRLRILLLLILGLSLLYGVAVGSYFGLAPPAGSWLATARWLHMDDYSQMMRIAITVGAGQLILANALVAWQRAAWPASVSPLGWIAVILGGLLLYGLDDNAPVPWFGAAYGVLISGLLIVATAAWWVARCEGASRLQSGLGILKALTQLSQLFGDVLSYLRLFALGLAGASLGLTFNQLALQVKQQFPGTGLLWALLIVLVGHGINLGLGIMSGVIHGLRLNYIEFFNWGLTDEGYPFRPFHKKEVG